MKITMKVDRASRAEVKRLLGDFERITGKGAEEGISEIAMSVARRLAHTVQPYGLTQTKGEKLEKSIAKQVHRAIQNANVTGKGGGARSVHSRARDGRGRVPRELGTEGQFRRDPIEFWDRDRTVEAQMRKAGRAKAAWVEAANKIGKANMSGVGQWIKRHLGSGYGHCRKTGSGLKYAIELENKTSWIRKIQPTRAVQSAINTGFKNGYKRIQRIIDKQLRKLTQ